MMDLGAGGAGFMVFWWWSGTIYFKEPAAPKPNNPLVLV
jgi:hypothetical protein